MGMRRVVVRTTATTVVTEDWTLLVDDDLDINPYSWNAGWGEALEEGRIELEERVQVELDGRRDVEVDAVLHRWVVDDARAS